MVVDVEGDPSLDAPGAVLVDVHILADICYRIGLVLYLVLQVHIEEPQVPRIFGFFSLDAHVIGPALLRLQIGVGNGISRGIGVEHLVKAGHGEVSPGGGVPQKAGGAFPVQRNTRDQFFHVVSVVHIPVLVTKAEVKVGLSQQQRRLRIGRQAVALEVVGLVVAPGVVFVFVLSLFLPPVEAPEERNLSESLPAVEGGSPGFVPVVGLAG